MGLFDSFEDVVNIFNPVAGISAGAIKSGTGMSYEQQYATGATVAALAPAGAAAGGAGAAGAAGGGGTSALSTWGPAAAMGGLSFLGGERTNEANAQQAREQMQFQERMSSTAHQREVADLKAAGLNPILSANAGSSTPSGAQATMGNSVQGAMASALDMKRMQNEMAMQKEQIKLARAQINKTNTESRTMGADAEKSDILSDIYQGIKSTINQGKEAYNAKDAENRANLIKPIQLNPNRKTPRKTDPKRYENDIPTYQLKLRG